MMQRLLQLCTFAVVPVLAGCPPQPIVPRPSDCPDAPTPPPCPACPDCPACETAEPPPLPALEAGETRGVLDDDCPIDARGRRGRRYALALERDVRVRLVMRSSAVDSMIEVTGPDGFRQTNDDAVPHTLDALLDFLPPRTGTYELLATTASAGDAGAYTLMWTTPESGVGKPFELGDRVEGQLETDSGGDFPGEWYRFPGRGGSLVRLTLASGQFDTVLTVLGPGGQRWHNDDADAGVSRSTDSVLVMALPDTGMYELVVSGYRSGSSGRFTITSSVQPPVVVQPGAEAPVQAFAGPESRGRILGLYAGITAYREGPLYGCADDARLLAEAMRLARLQGRYDQRVLTDSDATRAGFREGLRWLAEKAQEHDVVIVFWSGHGDQVAAPSGNSSELDGKDETIRLLDGDLVDDEVVRLLDDVRAATIILALDSCHSGGFADDLVTRPGRIGLFSSDEDVLSDTAEPRRAGGYLSFHLRHALLGRADYKPRDGVLYAGELTDYLYAGFLDDYANMNPEGDSGPAQQLVIRRGSVAWSHVLWVYPRLPNLQFPADPLQLLESAARTR